VDWPLLCGLCALDVTNYFRVITEEHIVMRVCREVFGEDL
jgi:hypothetical protein